MPSPYWNLCSLLYEFKAICCHGRVDDNHETEIYSKSFFFYQGRLFSYHDTHLHRLGTNYLQLPVNCPYRTRVTNYQRDGPQTFDNQGNINEMFMYIAHYMTIMHKNELLLNSTVATLVKLNGWCLSSYHTSLNFWQNLSQVYFMKLWQLGYISWCSKTYKIFKLIKSVTECNWVFQITKINVKPKLHVTKDPKYNVKRAMTISLKLTFQLEFK